MNQINSQKISHVSSDVGLMVENVTQNKKGIMIIASGSVQKQYNIRHVMKAMLGILEWDNDCDIDEYLKDCEYIKSLIDDLVVTYDEIVNTQEDAPISSSNGINYWLINVVVLSITCLLSVMFIVVKFYIKHGLIISRLLSC